jgi:CTP-dependent riboflavin kinase
MIEFEEVKIKNGFIGLLNNIHKGGFSVYCALLAYSESDRFEIMSEVSLRELASVTGYSIEHVRRILRALEKESIIKRYYKSPGTVLGRVQKYEIIV